MYRTRIRDAAKGRPNLAGRFIVVTWGCGTACLEGAIIDARTGMVTMLPFWVAGAYSNAKGEEYPVHIGPDFDSRPESALLMIAGRFEYNADKWQDPSVGRDGLHYFVVDGGNELRYLRTITPNSSRDDINASP
jgi:hypothetical protein